MGWQEQQQLILEAWQSSTANPFAVDTSSAVDWRAQQKKLLEFFGKDYPSSVEELPQLDAQGGVIPEDLAIAKRVDLITLPTGVPGTNCSLCRYIDDDGDFCTHPEIRQPVNARNCCAKWDAPGTLRSWETSENEKCRLSIGTKADHWITIGGHPDPERGTQHSGGVPIKIDDEGHIVGGKVPRSLHGTTVGEFGSNIRQHRGEGKEDAETTANKREPIQRGRRLPGMDYTKTEEDRAEGSGQIDSHTRMNMFVFSKHNKISSEEVDGEHEMEAIKAAMDATRAFWSSNDPDARAIRRSDHVDSDPADAKNIHVGLNIVFTADKQNAGAGSGGPGSARVFWTPYSLENREERLGEVYANSLGVDPIYVLAHESHHAFGYGSELDHSSDVAAVAAHLATGLKFGRKPAEQYLFTQVASLFYAPGAGAVQRSNGAARRLRYLHKLYPEELKKAVFSCGIGNTEEVWQQIMSKIEAVDKRKPRPKT